MALRTGLTRRRATPNRGGGRWLGLVLVCLILALPYLRDEFGYEVHVKEVAFVARLSLPLFEFAAVFWKQGIQ